MPERRFACVDCAVTYRPSDPSIPIHITGTASVWTGYWFPVKNRCDLCSLARGLNDWAEFMLSQKKT